MSIYDNRAKGAYHIAENAIEYNPQRLNNFTLVVKGLEGIRRVGVDPASDNPQDIINDAQESIMLALKTCDVPKITQSTIEIQKGNSKIKFPGKPTFEDIKFTAYDLMGSNIKDTLYAWQNLSYNSTYDFIGNKSGYKKDCTLYEYTPSGDVVRYWDIKGAWLKGVEVSGFDTTSDNVAEVSADLVYDWAEIHLPDEI